MNQPVDELSRRIIYRNTDFFLKNYASFLKDVPRQNYEMISEVELECLGYGVFRPEELLENFREYVLELLRVLKGGRHRIRVFKIRICGFKMNPNDSLLLKIAENIQGIKDNLSILHIKTANLRSVAIKDFNELLRLLYHLSDINFEDYALQCANWTFAKTQPDFFELQNVFKALLNECSQLTKLNNRKFRLEMSGWYYGEAQARAFLGFRADQKLLVQIPQEEKGKFSDGQLYSEQAFSTQLQSFHKKMQELIKKLLEAMDNIEQLEIDMRNSHDCLKLSDLKKRLINLSKSNRPQKSIISRTLNNNKDSQQKELMLNIMM